MTEPVIIYPNWQDHIPTEGGDPYVDIHGLLEDTITRSGILKGKSGRHILLNGPHGLGKSLLAKHVAIELSKRLSKPVPFLSSPCNSETRNYHLLGGNMPGPGGEVVYIPGPVANAIHFANEAGVCVLALEEFSSLNSRAQKLFNPLLDKTNMVLLPGLGKVARIKPGCHLLIIATMNPSSYGGVFALNADIRSRLREQYVDYPTMNQEESILSTICPYASNLHITKACAFANDNRKGKIDYKVSTRDLVTMLEDIESFGSDVGRAILPIANKFEGTDKKTMVDRLNAQFSVKLKVA